MTLSDAGFWFQLFVGVLGVSIVARAVWPLVVEWSRQRNADEERSSVDAYIRDLERLEKTGPKYH